MEFRPGDKVIHRREKDPRNSGEVMDIPPMGQKPGWIAVYFARKVWCKPENLRPLAEQKQQKEPQQKDISDFWLREA